MWACGRRTGKPESISKPRGITEATSIDVASHIGSEATWIHSASGVRGARAAGGSCACAGTRVSRTLSARGRTCAHGEGKTSRHIRRRSSASSQTALPSLQLAISEGLNAGFLQFHFCPLNSFERLADAAHHVPRLRIASPTRKVSRAIQLKNRTVDVHLGAYNIVNHIDSHGSDARR